MPYDIMLDSLTELAWGKQTDLATTATPTALMNFTTAPLQWDLGRYRFGGTRGRRRVAPSANAPITIRDRSTIAIAQELDFKDVLLALLASIDATPTKATPAGATDSRTYTFQPSGISTPQVAYFTLERRTSDADETVGKVAYQMPKGFSTGWQIASTGGDVATMTNNMQLGRHTEVTETTLTAPAEPAVAPNMLTTFGIYDTWAAMTAATPGATDTYGYSASYTSGHGILDRGAGVLDYDKEEGSTRNLAVTCSVYADSSAASLSEDEDNHVRANDERFVKLRLQGPEIEEVSGTSFPYFLEIGMACTHGDGSLTTRDNVGPEGRLVRDFAFDLQAILDGTATRDLYIQLQAHEDDGDAFGV